MSLPARVVRWAAVVSAASTLSFGLVAAGAGSAGSLSAAATPTGPVPTARETILSYVVGGQDGVTLEDPATKVTRVVLPDRPVADPAISPDATRIAFTAPTGDADGDSGIYVTTIDPAGLAPGNAGTLASSDPVLLDTLPVGDTVGDPKWSPDGTRLLYTSTTDGVSQIDIVSATDGSSVAVSTVAGTDAIFSHDGQHLIYTTSAEPYAYTIPISGGTPVLGGGQHFPVMDKQGTCDAGIIDNGTSSSSIYFQALTGGNCRGYVDMGNLGPGVTTIDSYAWSADGQSLYIAAKRGRPGADGHMEIYRTQLPGLNRTVLAAVDGEDLGRLTSGVTTRPVSEPGSLFTPMGPVRILDTRSGVGTRRAKVGPASLVTLKVAGVAGVPADATAVVLNVTGVLPTLDTHVDVTPWEGFAAEPQTSTLNLQKGVTRANGATVKVGDDGSVEIYNAAGQIDLLADVTGYFAPESADAYTAVNDEWIFDSQYMLGMHCDGFGQSSRLYGSKDCVLPIAQTGFVPKGTVAITGTVSVIDPNASVHVDVTAGDMSAKSDVSAVNSSAHHTASNSIVAALSASGELRLHIVGGVADVEIDLTGYYSASGSSAFTPVDPMRVFDSRVPSLDHPVFIYGESGDPIVQVAGADGIPADATAVALNVTFVDPLSGEHDSVTPLGSAATLTAAVPLGTTIADNITLETGLGGTVSVTRDHDSAAVVVDVVGYYTG